MTYKTLPWFSSDRALAFARTWALAAQMREKKYGLDNRVRMMKLRARAAYINSQRLAVIEDQEPTLKAHRKAA